MMQNTAMAIRYFVSDVQKSIDFYVQSLSFELKAQWGPAFAIVSRGTMDLWLSGPGTSAMKPMTDGQIPVPGGWNRIVVEVDDFDLAVDALRQRKVRFRNEPLVGPGGSQVLIEDPDGNPVEIFANT